MLIGFKGKRIDRKQALALAGYSFRPKYKDWIKWEGKGARFHAKPMGKNEVKIHMDIYTDETHHSTFHMPKTYQAEANRIYSLIPKKRKKERSTQETKKSTVQGDKRGEDGDKDTTIGARQNEEVPIESAKLSLAMSPE